MADTRDTRKPRILIVEDSTDLAELYALWLEDSYTVELAHDYDMAYAKLHEPIDVVLLDRHMPGGSGDELLTDIRELGLDCRVAMVTGEDPTIDVLEMDFDEYLCKPVTGEELQTTVSKLITRADFRDAATEFGKLTSKKALAEAHCSPTELAESDQYAALEERMEELQSELNEMTNSFLEIAQHSEV